MPVAPAPADSAVAGRGARPSLPSGWGIAVAGAAVALILEAIFIGSYVGALHDPKPREALPIGVVAPPQLAAGLMPQIGAQAGGVVDPRTEADEAALRRAIDDRKIYGGLVVGQQGATLIVADAAGPSAATVLTAFAQGLAMTQSMPLKVEHVRSLDTGDPRGLSLVYAVLGWVFGGYFCATVLTTLRGTGYRDRRHAGGRLLLLAAYAALSGLAGALLVGPVIGAISGHFWAMVLAGTLLVFAVAAATMALQLLLGIVGTAVVLVAFVLLGNPSAGGIVPPEFLPSFWRAVGPWLPNAAGFTLARNLVYFDGHAIAGALVVLAVYAVAGVALLLLFATRRRPLGPLLADPEAELAAAAAASL